MEIQELLHHINEEQIKLEDVERVVDNLQLEDLVVPSSISIESTLAEVSIISKRLYELHNKSKRDPIVLNKMVGLLELKTKLVGLLNVKPDIQNIIDSEVNSYKRRFLEIVDGIVKEDQLSMIVNKLTAEGL